MPLLHPGREVHLPAQNTDEQPVRLQLSLLPQPRGRRRSARIRLPGRDLRTYRRFLQAQLYRRAFPLLRRGRNARPDDGADAGNGDKTAQGIRLQRIHTSERDTARGQDADLAGGALCRPHELQRGTALRAEPETACAAKEQGERASAHARARRGEGGGRQGQRGAGAFCPRDRRRR